MGHKFARNRIRSCGKSSEHSAFFCAFLIIASLVATPPVDAQIVWTPMPASYQIKVLSPSDWITYDFGTTLSRTRDSGVSWEDVLAQPPDSAYYVKHFDWLPDGRGLVVYVHVSAKRDSMTYILARTIDDGATWRYSSFRICDRFPVPANAQVGRFIGGADSVLLVSVQGGVYRITNDDTVFTRCALPFSSASFDLYGNVDNLWILNGYKRDRLDSLAVSTDGGLSWYADQAPVQVRNVYTDWRGHVMMWSDDTLFVTTGSERVWHRIPLPVDGHVLAPSQPYRSVAMLDTSDVWMVHENYETHRMYLTRDGGRHWASADTPGHLRHRLDAQRALLDEYLLTIPDRQSLTLTATNRSSFTRSEALLEWNDPGVDGQIAGYTLERAGADSVWTPVDIDVEPPDQFCYVGQPSAGRPVFRYRLTMQALSGEVFVAVSDTVSMLPGAYVDVLDAILPDSTEHQQLVYEYSLDWTRPYPPPNAGDTAYYLTYTFFPAETISRWITRYPVRLDGDGPSGEHWTRWPWIDAYATKEGYFQYVDTSRSYRLLGYNPLGWSGRWFHDDSGWIAASKNRLVPLHQTGVGLGDSLHFDMVTLGYHGGEVMYDFVCKPVDGIIHSVAGGTGITSEGSESTRLTLLRTVNGTADIPAAGGLYIGAPYPNPVFSTVALPFSLGSAGHVVVTVHDMLGREVARLVDAHRDAGSQHAILDARAFRPGAYLFRVQTGCTVMTRMFVRP